MWHNARGMWMAKALASRHVCCKDKRLSACIFRWHLSHQSNGMSLMSRGLEALKARMPCCNKNALLQHSDTHAVAATHCNTREHALAANQRQVVGIAHWTRSRVCHDSFTCVTLDTQYASVTHMNVRFTSHDSCACVP